MSSFDDKFSLPTMKTRQYPASLDSIKNGMPGNVIKKHMNQRSLDIPKHSLKQEKPSPTTGADFVKKSFTTDLTVNPVSNTETCSSKVKPKDYETIRIVDKYNKKTFDLEEFSLVNDSNESVESKKKRHEQKTYQQKMQKRWLKIYTNYQSYANAKPEKLRSKIYNGIAVSFKEMIWRQLLNIPKFTNDKFEQYAQWKEKALQHSTIAVEQIDKDVQRTFKMHSYYRINYGSRQTSLFNLLTTYSYMDEIIGYTQGMNELAALLILYMSEEEAFWAFVMLMNASHFNMRGFYLDNLPLLEVFNTTLAKLVRAKMPSIAKHFEDTGYEISIFSTKWFMCLFIQNFSLKVVLRFWDVILYEGLYILVAIALVLIMYYKEDIMKKDMDELSTFFKISTISEGNKFENLMQDIKKLSDEFKKNGVKKRLDIQIAQCISGKDSAIYKIVKDEDDIRHYKESINLASKSKIFKHKETSTDYDPHSILSDNNVAGSTGKKINERNVFYSKTFSKKSSYQNILVQPQQKAPDPLFTYNHFKDGFKKYIEQNKLLANDAASTASDKTDINQQIYKLFNSNLEISDVAKIIQKYMSLKIDIYSLDTNST